MGESAAQTVTEIREVRDRLSQELDDLEERLPQSAQVARRAAGVALGGGVGGTIFWFLVRRARKRRAEEKRTATILKPPPVQAVVNVLPEKWAGKLAESVSTGGLKRAGAMAGGAFVLVKLAELREMRRLARMMAAR